MVVKRQENKKTPRSSMEYDVLYSKLIEERKLNKDLREKVNQLESQVSSLQESLSGLRESTTYKVGLAVSNSRSPRSFLKLPVELYKIFSQYKKKNKPIKIQMNGSGSEHLNIDIPYDDKEDLEKIWMVPPSFTEKYREIELKTLEEDDSRLVAKIAIKGGEEVVFFTKEISLWGLRHLTSDLTVTIDEFSETGDLLQTVNLEGPLYGLDTLETTETITGRSLAFSVHAEDNAKYLSVKIFDSLGLCGSLIDDLRYLILEPGVSVILPTYKGEKHIGDCLISLASQTIHKDMLEIVVVINGEPGGTEEIICRFKNNNPELSIIVVKEKVAGASLARNIGIFNANKQHITFVDDDDHLSDNFLEEMYESAASDKKHLVAFSSVLDVSGNTTIENPVSYQADRSKNKKNIKYSDVSSLLTMNACKLLPTFYVKQLRYNERMKSGEDVCFFTRYFVRYSPTLSLKPAKKGAIYYRTIRSDSVSRKGSSFDFNVKQRLEVIKSINSVGASLASSEKLSFATSKISAQSNFIFQYLENNMQDYASYVDLLEKREYIVPFYERIASKLSNTLVYSYCFTPYVDTAAVVMAKRIRERGEPVDVVYNNMSSVREVDYLLEEITKGFVGERLEIKTKAAFSNWKAIEQFVELAGREVVKLNNKRTKGHSKIYSRVMWPGSHFAALVHKIKSPDVKWTAEFSDPVLKDIHGNDRVAKLDKKWLEKNNIITNLKSKGFSVPETDNMFFWCEYLVFIFADEIVVTNKNQLKYMASYLNDKDVEKELLEKSVVIPHPTLSKEYYSLSSADYPLLADKVNFSYFGNFYATRGMSYIFKAISSLPCELRQRCQLHIFTNNKEEVVSEVENYNVAGQVVVNNYVGYFDFLALSNKMDCLIVNDALTEGVKIVNPYLPSKYSDYLGASSKIWGVCERGSVLCSSLIDDVENRASVSYIGDYNSIFDVLVDIIKSESKKFS